MHTGLMKGKGINMIEGSLLPKIILFVLPVMATNLLQTFYNVADTMIVGLSAEKDAVGSIGTTTSFCTLILHMILGVAIGINVVVANDMGARNWKKVSKDVHTSTIISLMFGLLAGGIGFALSKPILILMGNRGKLLELATLYCRVYFCGVPFIGLTNGAAAIFRAKGNTRTPLIVITLCGILNVVLNLISVKLLNMSVDGVAIATLLSNAVSAVVLYIILAKEDGVCKFSFSKLRLDLVTFKRVLAISIPASIQGAFFSISNMLIQSSIIKVNNLFCAADSAYQPVVKGNAATSSLEGFLSNGTNAVYTAAVSFTGQNCGANNFARIKKTQWYCYLCSFIISTTLAGIVVLLRNPLLSFYGVEDGAIGTLEHLAYDTAVSRMYVMFIPYFFLAFMDVGSSVLRGIGYSTLSMVISFIGSCVLRVVWIYTVFAAYQTVISIYLSYPVSWSMTALVHLIVGTALIKKKKKLFEARQAENPQNASGENDSATAAL